MVFSNKTFCMRKLSILTSHPLFRVTLCVPPWAATLLSKGEICCFPQMKGTHRQPERSSCFHKDTSL